MQLIKESQTMTEARTGNPYTIALRKNALAIPKRFYCHWTLPGDIIQYDIKGKELIDDPLLRCCFNHRVGLPTRKWETDTSIVEVIPVELTHFNHRMMRNYFKHRKYSQNKCRGSGASEILTIRYMVFKYGIMTNVKNRKCIILPGTSSKLSIEFSTRIKALCDKIPQIYRKVPTSDRPVEFAFTTGGRLVLTSATPDAERGFENVGDLDHEEVAHWDMVDDMPVYYASEGVFEKTKCHVNHNTTPRGKRGFYYDLVWSPEASSDFYKHVTNWREIVGLPVEKIEDLYELGDIDDKTLTKLRKDLVHRFHNDEHYRNWYETFEKSGVKVFWDNGELIPIEELIDVPIPILDINAIVADSQTDRSHYDQELDNEFISGENRAIGEFQEEDLRPDDLRDQIKKYDIGNFDKKEFDPGDFE